MKFTDIGKVKISPCMSTVVEQEISFHIYHGRVIKIKTKLKRKEKEFLS